MAVRGQWMDGMPYVACNVFLGAPFHRCKIRTHFLIDTGAAHAILDHHSGVDLESQAKQKNKRSNGKVKPTIGVFKEKGFINTLRGPCKSKLFLDCKIEAIDSRAGYSPVTLVEKMNIHCLAVPKLTRAFLPKAVDYPSPRRGGKAKPIARLTEERIIREEWYAEEKKVSKFRPSIHCISILGLSVLRENGLVLLDRGRDRGPMLVKSSDRLDSLKQWCHGSTT